MVTLTLTLAPADALAVLEFLAANDGRRADQTTDAGGPMSIPEIERRLLDVLPCDRRRPIYEKAGIPRPWRRAGNVLRRLREHGLIVRGDGKTDWRRGDTGGQS